MRVKTRQYASINTMGQWSRHTAQEGDAFCLLEVNVIGAKIANQSQNNSKGPFEDAGGNRYLFPQ